VRALFLSTDAAGASDPVPARLHHFGSGAAASAAEAMVIWGDDQHQGLPSADVRALASDDVRARLGQTLGPPPMWGSEAVELGLGVAAVLMAVAVAVGLLVPAEGDVAPFAMYLGLTALFVGFLAADRARRSGLPVHASALLGPLLPWRLVPDLLLLHRARNGIVVSVGAGGRPTVVHHRWPSWASVPHGVDDEWAVWIEPDGALHTVAAPVRWWRRGAVPSARRVVTVYRPTVEADELVRALMVRRLPDSKVLAGSRSRGSRAAPCAW
jgi:hypothetical protein